MAVDFSDFASNCTQSALLYNALQSGDDKATALLQAFAAPSTNISANSVRALLSNRTFVHATLYTIGKLCQKDVCSSLQFAGNADIGGIGSVTAYGLIALLSSIIVLLVFAHVAFDEYLPALPSHTRGVMKDFVCSLIYLQIAGQVAFWSYLPKMKTLYELLIALLVARMIAGATSLTAMITRTTHHRIEGIQLDTYNFGLTTSLATAVFSLFPLTYANKHSFIDSPCVHMYGPLPAAVRVSGVLHLLCVSTLQGIGAIGLIVFLCKRDLMKWADKLSDNKIYLAAIFGVLLTELFLLPVTFALILRLRQRAHVIFGPDYADNALGYGQILAIGSCLQFIWEGFWFTFLRGTGAPTMDAITRSVATQTDSPNMGDESASPSSPTKAISTAEDSALQPLQTRSRTDAMEQGLSTIAAGTSVPRQPTRSYTTSSKIQAQTDSVIQKRQNAA